MIDFERFNTKNNIKDTILRAKSDMYNSGCHNMYCRMNKLTLDLLKGLTDNYSDTFSTLFGMGIKENDDLMYGVVQIVDAVNHKQCMVMIDDPWKEDENEMFKFNNNYNSDNMIINRREFMVLPSKYIVNKDACILWDAKGDKTVVKRYKKDKIDPVKAFLWAYFIKNCGLTRTKANKYLEEVKSKYDEFIKDSK